MTESLTPNQMAFRKFRRHKMAWFSLWILAIFYVGSLFAEFIAPYRYDHSFTDKSYHPPTRIRFVDAHGQFHLWPFVYATQRHLQDGRNLYHEDTTRRYPLKFCVKGDTYKMFGLVSWDRHFLGVEAPGHLYLLGADKHGRDILTRLIYGGRISLTIGPIGVCVSLVIGLFVGGISGYYGGWRDNVLMRFAELFMSFPTFFFMLALRSILPLSLTSTEVFLMITIILAVLGWGGMARVIRGIVLSLRESDFVLAAKALGVRDVMIIVRHILPNTASYVIVSATLSIPSYILGESALSFLSLGIEEPQVSWGNMLIPAMSISDLTLHPWILSPGCVIFVVIVCFNLLGDALRDAFDPKAQG